MIIVEINILSKSFMADFCAYGHTLGFLKRLILLGIIVFSSNDISLSPSDLLLLSEKFSISNGKYY